MHKRSYERKWQYYSRTVNNTPFILHSSLIFIGKVTKERGSVRKSVVERYSWHDADLTISNIAREYEYNTFSKRN